MQVSWCKLEVEVATPKSVMMASAEGQPQDVPPLVVAALNLKTRFNAQVPPATHAVDKQGASTCCKRATACALPASEIEPLLCCAMLCCIVPCAMTSCI